MEHANIEPELLTGDEVRRILSIGKSLYWDLIWSGKLPSKRIGRRVLVSREALTAFIDALPSASQRLDSVR